MTELRQQRPETKIGEVCTRLRDLALQKEPHARIPTVRDLCEWLHCSRSTLDDALYLLEQQNVIYRKHGSGIFVSPKLHRKTICILLDATQLSEEDASPFWGMLWGLFAQEAQRRALVKNEYHSLHLVVHSPNTEQPLPEEVVTMIQAGRVHGFLAVALNDQTRRALQAYPIPCVSLAVYSPYMVMIDDVALAELAVRCLAEQGCRKIGLWALAHRREHEETSSHWHHSPVFRKLLATYDIPYRPFLVRDYLTPPLISKLTRLPTPYEQGYLLAMNVFEDPDLPKPDGIFITDDMMTDGVLSAFHKLGIRTGRDVKIATHGNKGSMMSFNHVEGVTVIEYDPEEVVLAMFALLDLLFSGKAAAEMTIDIKPKIRQPQFVI